MTEDAAGPASDSGGRAAVREVPVAGGGIRLGQLLKLADLAGSGAEAKALLATGVVRVNGQVEVRRGRQLERGDEVQVAGQVARLV
jgi:ribosome-associated protein